jgi:hypothetical protein
MEQIVIAHKKLLEAASLLAAANERTLADKAETLTERVDARIDAERARRVEMLNRMAR